MENQGRTSKSKNSRTKLEDDSADPDYFKLYNDDKKSNKSSSKSSGHHSNQRKREQKVAEKVE